MGKNNVFERNSSNKLIIFQESAKKKV